MTTATTKYSINDIDLVYLDEVIERLQDAKDEASRETEYYEARGLWAQAARTEEVSTAYEYAANMIRQAIADAEEQERLHREKVACEHPSQNQRLPQPLSGCMGCVSSGLR